MFNEQFTYTAETVFGNPTFNSQFEFRMGFGIFYYVETFSHSFRPIEDDVSMTYLSVHVMRRLHLN